MSEPHRRIRKAQTAPFFMQVHPLHGHTGKPWTMQLEPGLLTLLDESNRPVLKLPREDTSRYVRFAYDLLRGHTESFVVIEGLKSYTFRCKKDHLLRLLSWMPHKTSAQVAKEVRYSGVGVALFGVLHLALPHSLFWGWGLCLLAAGALGTARPRLGMYLLNGIIMLAAGLWALVPWSPTQSDLPSVIAGSVLVLWAIQQFSMLSPNQQLRAARAVRDQRASFLPEQSQVVDRIQRWNLAGGAVFGLYALAVLVSAPFREGGGLWARALPVLPDVAVFGVLSLVALGAALGFLIQRPPRYFEAKMSAQLLIVAALVSMWGVVFAFDFDAPLSVFGGLFDDELELFAKPYVWLSLMVAVLAFNRWYIRRVDRELEEQRD